MKHITTGVDKLVQLVSEEKKITLDQAAKQLSVGKDTVREWSEFLEKEGFITIKYRFSTVWLEEYKISEKQALNIGKELVSEKDILRRKVDVAISRLQNEANALSDIKSNFNKIQSEIQGEVSRIKEDLKTLDRFDGLKQNLENTIQAQKKDYTSDIESIKKDVDKNGKQYEDIEKQLKNQSDKLESHKKKLSELLSNKKELDSYIDQVTQLTAQLQSKSKEYYLEILRSQKEVEKTQSQIESLSQTLTRDKDKQLYSLIERIQNDKQKVNEEQDELLKTVKEKSDDINTRTQNSKKLFDEFKKYFSKQTKLELELDELMKEKDELIKLFTSLRDKLIAFEVVKNTPEVRGKLTELQSALESYEKRRVWMRKKIESLLSFIKG